MDITDHLLPQVRVFWVEGTAAPVDAQVPKPCTGQRGLLTQVIHSASPQEGTVVCRGTCQALGI